MLTSVFPDFTLKSFWFFFFFSTAQQGGLSPDRQGRDVSPGRQRRRRNYRRQSTTMGGYNVRSYQSSRSPESSSSCSSREPSPAGRTVAPATSHRTPIIRRQSTTEEILIARGFRRQVRVRLSERCRGPIGPYPGDYRLRLFFKIDFPETDIQ